MRSRKQPVGGASQQSRSALVFGDRHAWPIPSTDKRRHRPFDSGDLRGINGRGCLEVPCRRGECQRRAVTRMAPGDWVRRDCRRQTRPSAARSRSTGRRHSAKVETSSHAAPATIQARVSALHRQRARDDSGAVDSIAARSNTRCRTTGLAAGHRATARRRSREQVCVRLDASARSFATITGRVLARSATPARRRRRRPPQSASSAATAKHRSQRFRRASMRAQRVAAQRRRLLVTALLPAITHHVAVPGSGDTSARLLGRVLSAGGLAPHPRFDRPAAEAPLPTASGGRRVRRSPAAAAAGARVLWSMR